MHTALNPKIPKPASVAINGSAASKCAADPLLLDRLLKETTGDKYAYCHGKFLLECPEGVEQVRCGDLRDPIRFDGIIDRFAEKYGRVDRRAVVSMWTMYYFSTLAIGAAVHWLELRRKLPLDLNGMAVCLDPVTGEPQTFILPSAGEAAEECDIHAGLAPLVRGHMLPLVDVMAVNGNVSPRLIWSNVVAYLAWIVDEIGRLTDPSLAEEGKELLHAPTWPGELRNPMAGLIQPGAEDCGDAAPRRRICCLRYALPGVPGCGMSCPLPGGRC
ncbi:siderophore-iron reductase FhuF [Pseudomonas sp. R2.Fl]|nr:siderophore-iron reductase FhuF [Pseudomonas sp. R2.Fl]